MPSRTSFLRRAAAFLALAALALTARAQTITFEAEYCMGVGTTVASSAPGYSGTGYVTGFDATGDLVRSNFTATAGLYNLLIRFRTPNGNKGFNATLNGTGLSGMFPATNNFSTFNAGLVQLVTGVNTFELGGGWNWYEIDRFDFVPVAVPGPPLPVSGTLVDTQATFAARVLMQRVVDDYGKHTLSGQHDTSDITFIYNTSGRKPAFMEGDFIEYSPSRVEHGSNPGNYTENCIALESSGYILSFCWHWNAPTNLIDTAGHEWWSGFYTHATTFDVQAALANTNSAEYSLLLRDIDAIAVQLKKLASNNIPVLWRPLHEPDGGWFWWGAKGAVPFKQLWRLMFNRLTVYHGLHNLIWTLAISEPSRYPEWYPGNDVVDVVGIDAYPSDKGDPLSGQWEALKALWDGVKPIALTEFGGVPDIEKMQNNYGVWWAWFCPWVGMVSSMPTSTIVRIYQSPVVITLDEFNAVPPFITSINSLGGGAFQLMGTGPRGATNPILCATNLNQPMNSWSQISTGKFAGGVFTYTDTQFTNDPQRFYRVFKP